MSLQTEANYYESILMGSGRTVQKEIMARKALELIDRVNRALNFHKASKVNDEITCAGCAKSYPCPTVRSLTGM